THARNRNPVIPSKISGFPFYAAFLVALTRSAKLARITPVRTECYKPGRFFTPGSTQNLLYRRRKVVITQTQENTAKICESQLVRFQKRLLRGTRIRAVERSAAGHAAHRKHLQLRTLAGQIGPGF